MGRGEDQETQDLSSCVDVSILSKQDIIMVFSWEYSRSLLIVLVDCVESSMAFGWEYSRLLPLALVTCTDNSMAFS